MSPSKRVTRKANPKKDSNNGNKILNYVERNGSGKPTENPANTNDGFSVDEGEFNKINDNLIKPQIITQNELQTTLNSMVGSGDVGKMLSVIVNAYGSLAKAVDTNFNNCTKIAESMDENADSILKITDQLNDNVENLSRKHHEYVNTNENDKQQLKLKTDIRYYKSQMIIYLKNDDILKSWQDNYISIAEKIIKDQSLHLGRAYITKAIVLSGMKKINNMNKYTKYLYIHFSDCFTSERLIMEMIKKNKNENSSSPDVIFSQPSSYDIRRLKSICHDLQSEGSVSKVYLGDDAIKVTLNKKNADDPNEKPKKVHVRNFADLDKLRNDVRSKNCNVSTRTYYNSEYWAKKNHHSGTKRRRKSEDDFQSQPTSSNSKKQKRFLPNPATTNDNEGAENESINSSFNSANDNES